jgi:hypothetical protein
MSRCSIVLTLGCVWHFAFAQEPVPDEVVPLPSWSEEDAKRIEQGESMLYHTLFEPINESDLAAPVVQPGDLPLITPDELLTLDPTVIEDEYLPKYFGEKPRSFLVDPQKILSRQEYRDHLSFLKYHASDSAVKMYLYVFDAEQIIPASVRAEDILATHFVNDGPTALVFYFMGNPQRSQIFLSADLMRSVGRSERARALQSSINQAIVKSQAVDQLDGFSVQLSIRIYWMEKALESGVIAPHEPEEEPPTAKAGAGMIALLRAKWNAWKIPFGCGVLVLVVASTFHWWRKQRMTYRLPRFPVAARLQAPHGAGVGAVVTHASARIAPAMQREQVPDFTCR